MQQVVIGTERGVFDELAIDDGKKVLLAYPSPDGRKVFVAMEETRWDSEIGFDTFVVAHVWDLEMDRLVPIVRRGPMAAFFDEEVGWQALGRFHGTLYSPWSSDGRKLTFLYRESTGYSIGHRPRLHIVHYEEWAERRGWR